MNSILLNKLLIIFSIFLISCTNLPKNPDAWMESQRNACLPTAIAFRQALKKQDIWAKVVRYGWFDYKSNSNKGHAIVAYLYPPGENKLWTYDFWGSYRTRAFINDPYEISQKAVDARGENRKINFAEFLD